MMYMRWKTARSFMLTLSLFLSGCSIFPAEEEVLAPPLVEPTAITYELAKVAKGDITYSVKGNASFTTASKHELSFKDPQERLKEFHVKIGDKVKKGQVMAELDMGDIDHKIQVAQLELKKAQLAVHELESDQNRTFQLQAAKVELAKAELEAKVSETKLAYMEVEKARLKVQELQDNKEKQYALEKARLEIRSKELDLATLQRKKIESQLTSPIDGEVVFVSNSAIGDKLEPYQSLMTIADTGQLQILYTARDPQAIKDVEIGMPVTLSITNQSQQTGKVVQTPRNLPPNLTSEAQEYYRRSIIIRTDGLTSAVALGTSVEIEVIIQKHANTLVIPRNALKDFSGRKFVQVMQGKSKKEVDVEVGIENPTEVEILKGLHEGDLVILE
ncbi:efflux RND transporter periplasmic adaptor subunit [Brevibacillus ginsengisoli]|uniref:efflux RND transporter periplasmic adaptor subunit n=1 Tax=Brevibacillus ginsengisoli TaxID=363854 RepID=UPI003CE6F9EE